MKEVVRKSNTGRWIKVVLVLAACLILIGSEFVFRGDFSNGASPLSHKIIEECNSAHRSMKMFSTFETVDISPTVKTVISIGSNKDEVTSLLKEEGFHVEKEKGNGTPLKIRDSDEIISAKKDSNFYDFADTRWCSVTLFIKNNKIEDLYAIAAKGSLSAL